MRKIFNPKWLPFLKKKKINIFTAVMSYLFITSQDYSTFVVVPHLVIPFWSHLSCHLQFYFYKSSPFEQLH